MIPLCDVRRQYQTLRGEIDSAMQDVAAAGRYILGPNVTAFESEVADYCGASHAVGVGSGTDALHLALRALQIGPGDEVITTPFSFVATTEAIGLVGAHAACQLRQARSFFAFPDGRKGFPATPLGQRGEVATAGGGLVAGASVSTLVAHYRPKVLKV